MGRESYSTDIFSPLSGRIVDLGQVPDEVYSQRMIGDGVAIIPEDGTMFSPITGYVTVIADDKHAFGFTTDDGLEILVHMGVDGHFPEECAAVHVKINDRVQAGDMIAEYNLEGLKELGINPITPIIICGDMEGKRIEPAAGQIKAGAGAVITVVDVAAMELEEKAQERTAVQKPAAAEAAPEPEVQAVSQEPNEVLEFLRDRRNWPRLIGGLAGMTAILVVIFVGIAMAIGH